MSMLCKHNIYICIYGTASNDVLKYFDWKKDALTHSSFLSQ